MEYLDNMPMKKTHRRERESYSHMLQRCNNPNNDCYEHYGECGIKVCDRWLESFQNFFDDMGYRPIGYSLDRKDVNGNYCKENCEWSSTKEQARNKRNSVYVEYNGKNKLLIEICEEVGVEYSLVLHRTRTLKWTLERALNTPVKAYKKNGSTSKIKAFRL